VNGWPGSAVEAGVGGARPCWTEAFLRLSALAWLPVGRMVRGPDAQVGHARTVAALRRADSSRALLAAARRLHGAAFPDQPTRVGGVTLAHPFVVAAGLVKGDGFASGEAACAALARGRDIVPGWRSLPALVGAVEFGSYTRWPRLGNPGRVVWRDMAARSMQNRIGLCNPGASAAAAFLGAQVEALPRTWGISLAVSPGLDDPDEAEREIREAAAAFESALAGHPRAPSWYTLNLSCPNTGDDPQGRQSEELARRLCAAVRETVTVPVWVKVGPDLSTEQLQGLVSAFLDTGVRAVVATNTVARPAPGSADGDSDMTAGLSGALLRPLALDTVRRLAAIIAAQPGAAERLDIVACGGIMSGADWQAFRAAGARAAMLYSALVFRGPLAAAHILAEADRR
jgi:dihydroorotate dehydrogenase